MNPDYAKIKHIFFDLDHTLWDFDTNSELAFTKIFKTSGWNASVPYFMSLYIPINSECWKLYENNELSIEDLKRVRLEKAFDAFHYYMTADDIEYVAYCYDKFLPEYNTLIENAIDTLEYLSQKYTLHIVTNGNTEMQYKKMDNAKITHFFKTFTNTDISGAKKPDPKIYQHALKLANAEKLESIMIGDSMHADVQGALDFGIKALFFNQNDKIKDHNYTQITNLAELKILL